MEMSSWSRKPVSVFGFLLLLLSPSSPPPLLLLSSSSPPPPAAACNLQLSLTCRFCSSPYILLTVRLDENQAALDNHFKQEYVANLTKLNQEESLLAAPLDIKTIKPFGGFASR